jgi:hypothetical protein
MGKFLEELKKGVWSLRYISSPRQKGIRKLNEKRNRKSDNSGLDAVIAQTIMYHLYRS